MSNGGRYGAGLSKYQSPEAALAAIQTELKNQSKHIEIINKKLDGVSTTVTKMNTQMEHLVTKEACAEGRTKLADDLKKRMDGEREITGSFKVPPMADLWREEATAAKASDSSKPDIKIDPFENQSPDHKSRGFVFWLSIVAAFVTISAGIIGVTFAAYKVADFIDTTSTMMQQMRSMQDRPR
jgi:hypothetical protein